MHRQLKNTRFYIMILSDVLIFIMSIMIAYLLRFEFDLTQFKNRQIYYLLVWLIPLKLTVFFSFGLYKGIWRYTSIRDFWRLAQACFISMLLVMGIILYLYRFQSFSRAVFLMDWILTFILTGGLRFMIRTYYAFFQPHEEHSFLTPFHKRRWKRMLIIGAGDAGEKILREILENRHLNYEVVGFVDDDPQKQDRSIHGIPVMGTITDLPDYVKEKQVEEVLITIPSATGDQLRKIMDVCKECGVSYKTLPGIGQIIDGRVSIKSLRDVSFEDLLGRPPIQLNVSGIRGYIDGKVVLITGCGGSIGSELCRQVVRFQPRTLILVDASEANLFQIQMELHHEMYFHRYQVILGQVQDKELMGQIFHKYRPNVIFHAAAYKHVPMLEKNPWEAIINNVLGSKTVMELSIEYRLERFVLVSTDKAVRPTSVMGASKRVTELLLQSFQGNGTRFMAVRFGNVVGSSGSVIPLFRRQIEYGGPVTVTHSEATRYFMTIPEAAQLIIQAGAIGQGGEIFILEMGTPVRIADMAQDLIRLSGKELDQDIRIVFTGLREGEKLHEELVTDGEDIISTEHKKIKVLRSRYMNSQNESTDFRSWLDLKIEDLIDSARKHEAASVKEKLKEIVPEYMPNESESVL